MVWLEEARKKHPPNTWKTATREALFLEDGEKKRRVWKDLCFSVWGVWEQHGKSRIKKGIKEELESNQHMINNRETMQGCREHWEPYIDPGLSLCLALVLSLFLCLSSFQLTLRFLGSWLAWGVQRFCLWRRHEWFWIVFFTSVCQS